MSPQGYGKPGARSRGHLVRSLEHEALGRAIREIRARRGISQEEVGAQADIHRNYVGAVERGELNPTFAILLRLCRGLRIQLKELVTVYHRQVLELRDPPDEPPEWMPIPRGPRPPAPAAPTATQPENE